VRDRDAGTHAGRTELFALHQYVEDLALAASGEVRRFGREFVQRLLLAVDLERRNNRLRRDEII
jgi:hypothetical protein